MTNISDLFEHDNAAYITAPMINQSDLPFRSLTIKYGATITYTQMLRPNLLVSDQDYLEYHLRSMHKGSNHPVVAQVCGNDVQQIVEGCKMIVGHCDAIDLNLGCPLESAREEHFGSYLLNQQDWPLIENIVSALSHTFPVPISTKLRLCNPATSTLPLAKRLQHAGSSWIALHARFGCAPRKRRHGPADLDQVRILKESLDVPVISNGNVRCYDDVVKNLETTGADGIMVGEALLANPCLFANFVPDPVAISLEYLDICRACPPDTVKIEIVKQHLKHTFNHQCSRRTWYNKFLNSLSSCRTLDDFDQLLRIKVQRWRGKPVISGDSPPAEADSPPAEADKDSDGEIDRDVVSAFDGLHLLS